MFGTPWIWSAPAGCWWGEEKVQSTGLTTRSPQLAATFQALALEFSRFQELLCRRQISTVVTLELEAGRPAIQTHILWWQGSFIHTTLMFRGCLHPPWVTTYRCDAAQKGGKAGKKFWGPKSWRLFFLFCDFRGGRWDGEEGAISVSVPVLSSVDAGSGAKDHTLNRNIQGKNHWR